MNKLKLFEYPEFRGVRTIAEDGKALFCGSTEDDHVNKLQIFKHEEFGEIRTVEINGEPWLVGKDVAAALGYANASKAVMNHVDNEDKCFEMFPVSDSQNGNLVKTALINESGLYSLVLSSKLPGAKRFRRWVTSEVLPSIRKHGAYMTPETLENMISTPEFGIKLLTALKEEQEKRKALEIENAQQKSTIAIMEPKAHYHDIILQCKDLVPISLIAKDYGWSGVKMNKYLHEKGVQYKRGDTWVLYQKYAECGYTGTRTHEYKDNYEYSHAKIQTYWTQAGRLFIYELMKSDGILPLMEQNENVLKLHTVP